MSLPGLQLPERLLTVDCRGGMERKLIFVNQKKNTVNVQNRIINNQYFIHGILLLPTFFIAFIITGAIFILPYFSG